MDKETIIDILTIDAEIKNSFEEEEKNLDIYQEKLLKLKNLYHNNELTLKTKNDIFHEVENLEKKIEDIISLNSYNFYLMETSPLLNKYKEVLNKPLKISFFGKKGNDNSIFKEKDELITKFLEIASKYKSDLPNNIKIEKKKKKAEIHQIYLCENCDCKQGLELLDGKTYICHQCGFEKEILGLMSSFKDTSRVNLSNKYTYERRIHFRDCMNQYQGKQNSSIESKVFDDLEFQFELHGLLEGDKLSSKEERFKNITKDHILLFLKETGHTKHYEDVFLIFYKMTGKKPDDITYLENKLIEDFETLSNLYDKKFKHDKSKKIERKSFINIQYVLYQLLRKYKHPCKKEDFNILKTLDRKSFHDDIMKELFEELNWNFFSPQF